MRPPMTSLSPMAPSQARHRSRGRALRGAAMLALSTALAAMSPACGSRKVDPTVLRVGYFPSVTHVVALSAIGRRSFEAALSPIGARVEWKAFSAGPEAMEALFAGALDVCYVGPGPAEIAFLRSRGEALSIVAGASSGGAALVVRGADPTRGKKSIESAADLRGTTLATPQLGNTQDVALRSWLLDRGMRTTEQGGEVRVMPLASSSVPALMKRGDVDGAWVPEPWVTILIAKAGAHLLVDERTLWPGERFPTVVLVAARPAIEKKRELVARFVAAHVAEVAWVVSHRDEARALAGAHIKEATGKALPDEILKPALAAIEPTLDPMEPALATMAEHARRLGYLPPGSIEKLVDRSFLDAAARTGQSVPAAVPVPVPVPASHVDAGATR